MATFDYMHLAQIGFEAYKKHLIIGSHAHTDSPLYKQQSFDTLPVKLKEAWLEVALAISIDVIKILDTSGV